jgi:diguanylate cyclase (GGDEF)-like protein
VKQAKPRALHTLALLASLGVLLCIPGRLAAQGRSIHFDRLSLEQGLSQATVNCILQDRRGFMWFGTEDGLNRYDGYAFSTFKHEEANPSSLSHNFVSALLEDREGFLWVGTRGGLNRFDPSVETFRHFRNDPSDPTSLSLDRIRVVYEDKEGVVWIGTEGGGLDRFNRASASFERFTHDPANAASLGSDDVSAIREDRQGVLWIGTRGGGLDRFDRTGATFTHYRSDPRQAQSLSDDQVTALGEDRDGALWVGTSEGGLSVLASDAGHFVQRRLDQPDSPSLSANSVRAILQDDAGTLWVGTDAGLAEWSPERRAFLHHRNDPADPWSLGDDQVTALCQDSGGVLWVGTGAGVSRFNTRIVPFAAFKAMPGGALASRGGGRAGGPRPRGLSNGIVTAFREDRSGALWIGTFGGGLNRLDRKTGTFTYYRHQPSDPSSLGDNRVTSLHVDRQGVLWVGTFAGGLDRFDGAHFVHHRHDPDKPDSLSWNGVSSLCEDEDGVLWVGTFGGGINRFDRKNGRFVHYRHAPSKTWSLSDDRVRVIERDREGTFWVGTDGGGLNRFDRSKGSFTSFRHNAGDPGSISSDAVYSIHEDASGVVWIGTDAGLNRWDPADRKANRGRFERLGKKEGLPHEMIYGILSDQAGSLWLSTIKGLSRFDPRTKEFKNYNPSHGLQSYEFNFGAAYRSPSGEMFFGGVNGFNAFHPASIRENTHEPPVVLTGFWKFGQRAKLDRPVWTVKEIDLAYRDYVVSFEFAALDFTAPEQNRYAYKLEGLDESWTDLGTLRRVTYTNLAPGRYVLRVRGSNNDGVWNEQGLALSIRVIPPPWRTWWAYLLYTAALAGVVFAYVRAQARKLAREAEYSRKLEQDVKERTRELEERTLELAVSNQELQSVNLKLEEAALTDAATGLRNRRYLMSHIQEDLALVERDYAILQDGAGRRRSRAPDFLFLMMDLDGFKRVNDVYGHDAGDMVLLQVCELLRTACRRSDTLIRWGGDEFVIVGRGVDRHHAEVLAERVRLAIEQHTFDLGKARTTHLGASIGFAFYPFLPSDVTLLKGAQIMTVADRALYLAKASGRNAWVGIHATETTPHEELMKRINEDLERLVRDGAIELSSSIGVDKLVFGRA